MENIRNIMQDIRSKSSYSSDNFKVTNVSKRSSQTESAAEQNKNRLGGQQNDSK